MMPSPSPPPRLIVHRRPDTLSWQARIAIVLGVVLVLAAWGWLRSAETRALASMDPDLRRELFSRSRAEAETLCARPELADECRRRLEFLERFPECDASCRALVARHLRHPVR